MELVLFFIKESQTFFILGLGLVLFLIVSLKKKKKKKNQDIYAELDELYAATDHDHLGNTSCSSSPTVSPSDYRKSVEAPDLTKLRMSAAPSEFTGKVEPTETSTSKRATKERVSQKRVRAFNKIPSFIKIILGIIVLKTLIFFIDQKTRPELNITDIVLPSDIFELSSDNLALPSDILGLSSDIFGLFFGIFDLILIPLSLILNVVVFFLVMQLISSIFSGRLFKNIFKVFSSPSGGQLDMLKKIFANSKASVSAPNRSSNTNNTNDTSEADISDIIDEILDSGKSEFLGFDSAEELHAAIKNANSAQLNTPTDGRGGVENMLRGSEFAGASAESISPNSNEMRRVREAVKNASGLVGSISFFVRMVSIFMAIFIVASILWTL